MSARTGACGQLQRLDPFGGPGPARYAEQDPCELDAGHSGPHLCWDPFGTWPRQDGDSCEPHRPAVRQGKAPQGPVVLTPQRKVGKARRNAIAAPSLRQSSAYGPPAAGSRLDNSTYLRGA